MRHEKEIKKILESLFYGAEYSIEDCNLQHTKKSFLRNLKRELDKIK